MSLTKYLYPFLIFFSLLSCDSNEKKKETANKKEEIDASKVLNTSLDGKIFSIPSPAQTSFLIRSLDLDFTPSILADGNNVENLVDEHTQALNLGLYGADLGYSSLYDNKKYILKYLKIIQSLTSELGLNSAFDEKFMKEFESSIGDYKKMLILMSETFKKADNLLKHSEKKHISALILTGGWVESLHIATNLYKTKNSEEIQRRIAEQKYTLTSIIDILNEYNDNGKNDLLISNLKELQKSYDKVMINYEYNTPETFEDKKTTHFRHSIIIQMDDSLIDEINQKIQDIRNLIIK